MSNQLKQLKADMGYQTSTQRPQCGTCKWRTEEIEDRFPNDVVTFKCAKGNFKTTRTAVCKEYVFGVWEFKA